MFVSAGGVGVVANVVSEFAGVAPLRFHKNNPPLRATTKTAMMMMNGSDFCIRYE